MARPKKEETENKSIRATKRLWKAVKDEAEKGKTTTNSFVVVAMEEKLNNRK